MLDKATAAAVASHGLVVRVGGGLHRGKEGHAKTLRKNESKVELDRTNGNLLRWEVLRGEISGICFFTRKELNARLERDDELGVSDYVFSVPAAQSTGQLAGRID